MQRSLLAKRAWFVLFLAIATFYFWGLGSFPLVGPDEPRYAQVAREMLARRDPITPTLGGLPWFEKPPLLYWMIMLSYRVLGVSEYATRLGPAICGLLTGVAVFWIGNTVSVSDASGEDSFTSRGAERSLGKWSALVWLTSFGAIVFSRGASFDIVLTLSVTAALGCFFVGQIRGASRGIRSRHLGLLFLFHFFTGASLLAKGLIGYIIIYGVVIFYFLVRREKPQLEFVASFLWGFPLTLVIAGVWYGPMIADHGWTFIDRFIIQHHFERFLSNKYHHPAPFYFYLPVVAGLALPWTCFLGSALWASRHWHWKGGAAVDRVRVFGFAWLIVPVVFFTFSGAKLGAYVLPVLPAVALLAGERIVFFLRQERGQKVLQSTGVVLIIVALAASWYGHRRFAISVSYLALVTLPLVVVAILALIRPRLRRPLFVLIAIVPLITAMALRPVGPLAARSESVRDLLSAAAARGYATTPVVQLHTVERATEFYAAGRITYETDGEPEWYETVAEVTDAARRNNGVVLCFVPVRFADQLLSNPELQTEVIGDNGRVALVVVHVR